MTGARPKPPRVRAGVALALLLALLMLPNCLWLAVDPGATVAALVLPLAELACLFALFGRWPWLVCALLTPFAALAPLEAFYVFQYHHPTSAEIIATIVATNSLEVREYFGYRLLPLLMASLIGLGCALLAAWWCRRARFELKVNRRIALGFLGLAALLIPALVLRAAIRSTPPSASASARPWTADFASAIAGGYPFGLVPRVVKYRLEWDQMRREASRFKNFRFHAHRMGPAPRGRQVYVLVIGESSRRADWELFGYRRATNPELARIPNLVPLRRFITTWPESITAIPMIVTRRKPHLPWYAPQHEASILEAMREAGYETYWISNQQAIGRFDSPVSMYAYEAQHVLWLNHASWTAPNSYDGDLIAPLQHVLAHDPHDLFIVLHMMGSHAEYDYRYPKSFDHWKTLKTTGNHVANQSGSKHPGYNDSDIQRIHDHYDNSILYTDYVLAKVIDALKATHDVAALWFESDHGEALPTASCSLEGHGIGTVWEYEIPAFVWYSNAYHYDFPQRVSALRANADRRTLSANTFESIIDMAGVDFPGHDPTWSIFSPAWRYHTRWVAASGFIDFDQARVGGKCDRVLPASAATAGTRTSAW